MKRTLIILLFVFFAIQINAQQSKTGSQRPEGVSIGKIYNDSKSQIVISGVPTYLWHRGCGPTALGMVIGYYDSNGFSDLIEGDATTQTTEVDNAIANSDHYNDYSTPLDYWPNLEQDNSELGGAHTSNCIADFMQTSWSSEGNYWGWSWSSKIAPAFNSYVSQLNDDYIISSQRISYSAYSWDLYKTEIDNNRPVVFLVDSDGDGSTDHFVTGIGYDDATNEYAIYDTWDTQIHWYTYQGMSSSYAWGIYDFNKFEISVPVNILENDESIKTYPNPTTGIFRIDNSNSLEITKIEVFDISGKYIFSTNSTQIDISNLEDGIYLIKIITNNNVLTKKITKK
ncbi:MAG: T9SS type A sorting domain-containing protein [Bacteroidales bacterium]|nr:T9SS type A sorting domain-containing protein [Bacteroidales bacterium]